MNLQVISFTENGIELAERLAERIRDQKDTPNMECTLYTKASVMKDMSENDAVTKGKRQSVEYVEESLHQWTERRMTAHLPILFIGACGIAVRAIAPFVVNKLEDSPVLVTDELGQHVIPILSGHVGGANELATKIASLLSATLVITTATDLQKKFAVDIFAKRNGFEIENREGIAKVSSKVLAGKRITVSVEEGHTCNGAENYHLHMVDYPPEECVDVLISSEKVADASLWLRPREYCLGMGCRKETPYEKIEDYVAENLAEVGISIKDIYALSSIDIKKEEKGLCQLAEMKGIPFFTYSADSLREVEGDFTSSDFVKATVGVDNVCERAALRACKEGKLVLKKQAKDGMTIAIAKRDWSVNFDE